MEESEIFNNTVDNLRRNLRFFYKVLDNLLFYSNGGIVKNSVTIDYEHCIGTLIRVDENFYPEDSNSGKLIGFEVFENISRIYFISSSCSDTTNEKLENITTVNLESEAEIDYYLGGLIDTEELIIVNKLIEEKCRKILLDILLESSKREK